MNICLILISDGWGGGETVVYELAKHLRDREENISIILNQEIYQFYEGLDGINILNIGNVYNTRDLFRQIIDPKSKQTRECNSLYFPFSLLNELLLIIYFKRIRKQITNFLFENKIEIIHSHLDNSHLLAFYPDKMNVPWIGTVHGDKFLSLRKDNSLVSVLTFKKLKYKMILKSYSEMNAVTFVSKYLLDSYKSILPSKENVKKVYNGINLNDFKSDSKEHTDLKKAFDLLFPGGTRTVKNPEMMIHGLAKVKSRIPEIHLFFAGNVPPEHHIRQMVKDLDIGKNVTFTGRLPPEDYRNLLNSIDLFVLPSKREGLGISILEAMAMGKPIIASNKGGIPEIITDKKNGILIEPTIDNIADAIVLLYENSSLIEEFRHNGLEFVQDFDWNEIIDEYMNVYGESLPGKIFKKEKV